MTSFIAAPVYGGAEALARRRPSLRSRRLERFEPILERIDPPLGADHAVDLDECRCLRRECGGLGDVGAGNDSRLGAPTGGRRRLRRRRGGAGARRAVAYRPRACRPRFLAQCLVLHHMRVVEGVELPASAPCSANLVERRIVVGLRIQPPRLLLSTCASERSEKWRISIGCQARSGSSPVPSALWFPSSTSTSGRPDERPSDARERSSACHPGRRGSQRRTIIRSAKNGSSSGRGRKCRQHPRTTPNRAGIVAKRPSTCPLAATRTRPRRS